MVRRIVIAVAAFLFSAATVHAAAPIDIKITTIQLKSQQMGVGLDILSKNIKERLKDKVRVRTYPAAQLYTGKEEVEAVMKGEDQMAYVIASVMELIDPVTGLFKLPFLFPDIETAYKVWDGPLGRKINAKHEAKGVTMLSFFSSGTVAIHNSKHPIRRPEDFKGLKMRSFGPMGAASLRAMGAIAIVSVPEELYTSFQQGMLDGGANPDSVFYERRLYDVQKYITDAGMFNTTNGFLIANVKWWQGLPSDVRAGLSDAIKQTEKQLRADMAVQDKKLFSLIAAKGCQVYYLTADDVAAWKKALQPVYTEFTPVVGADIVKEAQSEAERYYKGHR